MKLLDELKALYEGYLNDEVSADRLIDETFERIIPIIEAAQAYAGGTATLGPPHRPECPRSGMLDINTPDCTCGRNAFLEAMKDV
jgi:hypothetical protein